MAPLIVQMWRPCVDQITTPSPCQSLIECRKQMPYISIFYSSVIFADLFVLTEYADGVECLWLCELSRGASDSLDSTSATTANSGGISGPERYKKTSF